MIDAESNSFTYQNTDMLCNVVSTSNGYDYILCDWEGAIVRSGRLNDHGLSAEDAFKAIFLKHCDFVFPSMAYAHDYIQVDYLIEKGVNVHFKNDLALRNAVANKHCRESDRFMTVKTLLDHGANPFAISEKTMQELRLAPNNNIFELIQGYREKAHTPIAKIECILSPHFIDETTYTDSEEFKAAFREVIDTYGIGNVRTEILSDSPELKQFVNETVIGEFDLEPDDLTSTNKSVSQQIEHSAIENTMASKTAPQAPPRRSIRETLKAMKTKCDIINANRAAPERANRNIDITR